MDRSKLFRGRACVPTNCCYLILRFTPLFKIIQRVGLCAYKLLLPVDSKIHSTFHVSCLKKAVGNFLPQQSLPSSLDHDFAMNFEPAQIVDKRYKRQHGKLVSQVLVQWKNRPLEDATWELTDCF